MAAAIKTLANSKTRGLLGDNFIPVLSKLYFVKGENQIVQSSRKVAQCKDQRSLCYPNADSDKFGMSRDLSVMRVLLRSRWLSRAGISSDGSDSPPRTIHAGFQPIWPERRMDSALWHTAFFPRKTRKTQKTRKKNQHLFPRFALFVSFVLFVDKALLHASRFALFVPFVDQTLLHAITHPQKM